MWDMKRFCLVMLGLLWLGTASEVLGQRTGRITGVVVDASNGMPLPGANVLVAGTTVGAATDLEGKFIILNAPAGPQTLVISYIGYQRKEVPVEVVPGGEVSVEVALQWAVSKPERL
ncbi:carboxypeptidase-like regulatory domain-containing protein [Rhodothermus marinus]|uniref:carboxypeptidase-like regulatory domain-containing protein n=1 Tax=Rhodothermus marinus TaxID=29549 RepID=UPI0006D1E916|nr:carboxypeptidase-like regulatory domain-containing protein [Rhodothermus marinus]